MPTSRISNEQDYEKYKEAQDALERAYQEFLIKDCPPVARTKLEKIVKGLILCKVEMTYYERQEGK